MASWDTAPTNIAMPAADFSALGAIGDDYAKRQKQKAAALAAQQRLQQQQGQPPDGVTINPQTGQPNYAAGASGFL